MIKKKYNLCKKDKKTYIFFKLHCIDHLHTQHDCHICFTYNLRCTTLSKHIIGEYLLRVVIK